MIEIKNPWNGIRIKLGESAVTEETLNEFRKHIDERIIEVIDQKTLTPYEWFKCYVDLVGPMAGGAAWFAERKVKDAEGDTGV